MHMLSKVLKGCIKNGSIVKLYNKVLIIMCVRVVQRLKSTFYDICSLLCWQVPSQSLQFEIFFINVEFSI